jgi:hypothetical protein
VCLCALFKHTDCMGMRVHDDVVYARAPYTQDYVRVLGPVDSMHLAACFLPRRSLGATHGSLH